jgi:predicted RNA-binding protein with PUA-like domain
MPNYWLVKTEPSTYSYDDLERAATAVWDGVKNPVALRNLRGMRAGDQVLVYHTGDEKAVIGWATVVSAPYADPKKKDPKLIDTQGALWNGTQVAERPDEVCVPCASMLEYFASSDQNR